MADLVFPEILLRFASISFAIRGASRGGPPGVTGTQQVAPGPAGSWTATVTLSIGLLSDNGSAQFLAYNALTGRMRGRTKIMAVPYFDGRGPGQLAGLEAVVPHDDGSTFDDGAEYEQGGTPVVLAASAATNDVALAMTWPAGMQPIPGQHITLPGGWMHVITDLVGVDGNTWSVIVSPWLRAAYPAGTDVEVDKPTCRMRLSQDLSGRLTRQAREVRANPTLEFDEAF